MRFYRFAVAVVILYAAASISSADTPVAPSSDPLAGLKGIRLAFEYRALFLKSDECIPASVPSDTEATKRRVEQALRKHGLAVYPTSKSPTESMPTLTLRTLVMKQLVRRERDETLFGGTRYTDIYAYLILIDAELAENARLDRIPNKVTQVTTWSCKSSIRPSSEPQLAETIGKSSDEIIETFLNEYSRANQKTIE